MREDGQLANKKGMLPPTYLLISIVAIVVLRFWFPGRRIIAFPWTLLGLVPVIAGSVLNVMADGAFKRHQTTVKPFEKSTALVTSGVYSISRHPMYLGFTLILLGLAIFMGALTSFVVVPLFAVLMELVFIRTEEPMMAARFGQSWLDYKQRVRRWI